MEGNGTVEFVFKIIGRNSTIFGEVLVGLLVVLAFSAMILVCIFYWRVLRKARRDVENRTITLKRRVMNEFLRRCGIRNMILLLLMGLILSYLFSCDKCIDVVMDFIISTSFDLPPAMQSSTMTEEEDCGECEKHIYDLATRHIKKINFFEEC